jgi:CelD/BcsL family acetyltransferase involved in cellulose biosynthesis
MSRPLAVSGLELTAPPQAAPDAQRVPLAFTVEVLPSIAAAAPIWRELEALGSASPFQHLPFLDAWMSHAGRAEGLEPLVIIIHWDGRPAALLPLCVGRRHGLKVARFMGGAHVSFQLGLWRPDLSERMTAADMNALLDAIRRAAPDLDMLALCSQPANWQGLQNPLLLLPSQPSPSRAYSGALQPDFEALLRGAMSGPSVRKFRGKERKLAERAPLALLTARTPDEARRILAAFLAQKAERMAELGLRDPFAQAGVAEFLFAAATAGLDHERPALELYALTVGDDIAAIFGGVRGANRFSGMFNSVDRARYGRESAGHLLLFRVIATQCGRGLSRFDLGVGDAAYKDMFCPDTETLFDQHIALTARGRLVARLYAARQAMKRRIKASPLLWRAVEVTRAMRARSSKPDADQAA